MDEMTLTLNSPITEEQWDMIEDVDFDHTDSITFHTKHGKEVEFVKRKTGKWTHMGGDEWCCDQCGNVIHTEGSWEHPLSNERKMYHCNICGADMRQKGEDNGFE